MFPPSAPRSRRPVTSALHHGEPLDVLSAARRLARGLRVFLLAATALGPAALHGHPTSFNSEINYTSSRPAGGPDSIAQWIGAAFDAGNVGGSGVNADGGTNNGTANDTSTYVGRFPVPTQGQTFTTGSAPDGYNLRAITVQIAGYANNAATGTNRTSWNLNFTNGPIMLFINRLNEGATQVVHHSIQLFTSGGTGNPGSGTSASGPGTYLTFKLPFGVHLDPNTVYSFDLANGPDGSNSFEWLGTRDDVYSGGGAYRRVSATSRTITHLGGDRVFMLDMSAGPRPQPFAHPGTLHTQADLDRMKAKIAANAEPWASSYATLAASPWAQTTWNAYDVDYINRGGTEPNNYTRAQIDAQAIYELALRWHLTGNTAYADRAVSIANVWSGLLGITGDSNAALATGICGYLFASGGELLSTYPGWPDAQKQAYKEMMMRVFYPGTVDFLWRHNDTFWRNGGNTHYRLNWATANMAAMAAIGILCDNRAVYEQAVDYFKTGSGNGRVERAAWYIFPDGTAQTEESGRDQPHNLGGWHAMALLCQMAWNQGDDLFGYDNNRVLRAFEYNAKYNLGNAVPWVYHRNTTLTYTETLSSATRGIEQYYHYELVYNHFANVKGVAAPWSKLAVEATRREPRPNTNTHPSQADWLGLGSLTYARDSLATDPAPSGLRAQWTKNRITLAWWGSARATAYTIKRATDLAGPYTTLGSVTGHDLTFTDASAVNGATYYYVISAATPSGQVDGAPLRVSQELVAHYTFDGSTMDVVGGAEATRLGGATAPGYTADRNGGQAIALNGGDQHVRLPVGSGNYQDITLSAWVYWNGGNAWQRVFDFGSEIEKYMMLTVKDAAGKLNFTLTTSRGADGTLTLVGPAMPTATWTHVAVTLNGDIATMYVNGLPVASTSATMVDPLFGQPFCYLGRSMWNSDPRFSGRIDDFRIYNYALSGSEIYTAWGGSANNPPVFTTDPVTGVAATEDVAYAQSLAGVTTDPDGGTLTYGKVSGPSWLTVSSTGALSGTPTNNDVGVNTFVVRVTDSSGATDDAYLHITVNNSNDAPAWSSTSITKLAVSQNIPYTGTLATNASDADAGDTFTYGKVGGPSWLAVAADGTLSGTPSSADVGTNSFVVRATDNHGAFADATLSISVLAPALQSRFLMDGTVADSLGATTATLSGIASYDTGVLGQALILEGATNYVTLGTLSGMVYNDFTVATWVYWNGGSSWQRIFDFGGGTDQYIYLSPSTGSGMRFLIRVNNVDQYVETSPLPKNQWVHVAVTLAGSTATLYVNGVAKASNTAVTNDPASIDFSQNHIGESRFSPDPLFSGLIDDFRLYNHALGASEVSALLSGVPAIVPTGLSAAPGSDKVTLTWNTSATAQTYTVKRGTTSGGPYSTIASGLTATSYTDTGGLTVGTTYYYVVSAANTLGESADSDEDAVLLSDLVAHIKFNETSGTTAADSSGNAFDGALVNGPAWTTGVHGNGVNLSATASQHVTLPSGIVSALGDFTISAWVNPAAFATWSRIFDFGTGTTNYMFLSAQYTATSPNGAKPRFAIRTASVNEQGINGTIALTAGAWNHVAVTLAGGTATLYVNGAVAGTNTAVTLQPSSLGTTTQNYIGRSQWSADPYLNAAVDEFRVYNRALTAAEVLAQATPAPSVPSELTATGNDGYVSLSWTAADAATSYTVKRATASGGPYTTVTNGSAVTTTSFEDIGLSNGTTYYYVVGANNWLGSSADSAEALATPYSVFWLGRDIGAVAAAGSSSYAGTTYTLTGSGADIYNTADEFYFRSVFVGGNCSITARVVGVQNTNVWAKAGVMVRSSLAASSPNAAVVVTPTTANGVSWQARSTDGGSTSTANTTGVAPPYWVRLVRTGDMLQGYRSADGTTWVSTGSASIAMDTNVYMGLAVTSHADGTLCTATFDNVSLVWTPAAPASLTATAGYESVSLSWPASDGATSYNIKRSLVGGGPYATLATGVNTLGYVDSNLTAGTTYHYVVSPVNAVGEGADSPETSATPMSPGTTVTFNSVSTQDGYVRESSETSNAGGTTSSTSLRIGDDFSDRQYKAIVSFDTSSIPDDATITSATLKLRRSGGGGTNPFTTHGTCYVDVKAGGGYSASTTLQTGDFGAAADASAVATMSNAATTGSWSTGSLNAAGRGLVNKTGTTQYRVYFALDDNDDRGNDYVGMNSGENASDGYAPTLEVIYHQEPPSTLPKVLLHLDETDGLTAPDSSGDGWTGTLVNGPAWTAGKLANAVSLDGADDHLTLPAGVVSDLNDCTISAWVKLNSVASWSRIFDFGTGTANYMFLTPTSGSGVRFAIKTTPSAEQVISGGSALPSGAWTHVAVVLSGSTGTLYVNGASVGTHTSMTLKPSSLGATTLNYLGRSQFAVDPYLNGAIDEFTVHGYALSASEITALATPPAAPAGVNATAGDAQAAIIWNASTRATSYNVKRATATGGPYSTVSAGVTTTTFNDSGLTNGTTYYYVVSALNAIGESADSAETSAQPLSAVQTWRRNNFGTIENSGTAADAADPDGDGWTNAQEFIAGTDPNDLASALKIGPIQLSGDTIVISFPTVSGKTYRIDQSDTLAAGSWTTLQADIAGTGDTMRITDTNAAPRPRRFYRLVVQ